jgi:TonB family protein
MRILARFLLPLILATGAIAQTSDANAPTTPVRVTENVKVTKMVDTVYPLRAQQEQIQGRVVLDVTVAPDGKVKHIDVISGDEVLAGAFKDAVKRWQFEPHLVEGKAVPFITRVGMNFALQGNVLKDEKVAVPPQAASPSADSANSAPATGKPDRIRVSSGVATGNLIYKVQPVYPIAASANHVQGAVILQALIGRDGMIKKLEVISGPEELTKAAVGAVEQWRYRPYLLNGVPVEVDTKIQVNFNLR